jgi:hypothetical protein
MKSPPPFSTKCTKPPTRQHEAWHLPCGCSFGRRVQLGVHERVMTLCFTSSLMYSFTTSHICNYIYVCTYIHMCDLISSVRPVMYKLRGFSPQANYTDRATTACRRSDHLCGLVVRVSGCGSRGPEFDSRRYQIF